MSPKSTEFGDAGGVSSSKGYDYQYLIAAYCLIVEGYREIECEVDGEDICIINENPNRISRNYIQAKYKDTGQFTLTEFTKEVFPQFWNAFETVYKSNPEKSIEFGLYTNVALDKPLKEFMVSCKNMRERGWTLKDLMSNLYKPSVRKVQLMLKNKDPELFRRFLWGVKESSQFPPHHINYSIINYLKECGITEPNSKLKLVKACISDVGQGTITHRKIEDILGQPLTKIKSSSGACFTDEDLTRSLKILADKKKKYDVDNDMPNQEGIYREMTSGLKEVKEALKYTISSKSLSENISNYRAEESIEIIESNVQKIYEEASQIAQLDLDLWMHKKHLVLKITSIENTIKGLSFDS